MKLGTRLIKVFFAVLTLFIVILAYRLTVLFFPVYAPITEKQIDQFQDQANLHPWNTNNNKPINLQGNFTVRPFVELLTDESAILFEFNPGETLSALQWKEVTQSVVDAKGKQALTIEVVSSSHQTVDGVYALTFTDRAGTVISPWKRMLYTWAHSPFYSGYFNSNYRPRLDQAIPKNKAWSLIDDLLLTERTGRAVKRVMKHYIEPLISYVYTYDVVDRFEHIPQPHNASHFAFNHYIPNNHPSIKSLRVFGESLQRYEPKDANVTLVTNQDNRATVTFKGQNETPCNSVIAGWGAQIVIEDIEEVYCLDRNHELHKLEKGIPWLLGSMLPHQLLYRLKDEQIYNLSFNSLDAIKVTHEDGTGRLTLDAYCYSFEERYQMTGGDNPEFHQEDGHLQSIRHHRNIGAARSISPSVIEISVVKSNEITFPLWQPEGRLATVVFVEHADYQEIETDKLFMFGNSEGVVNKGVGFIGNQIPLTKTVFPTGKSLPLSLPTPKGEIIFHHVTVEKHLEWAKLLKHYQTLDYDIELGSHTTAPRSKNAIQTEKCLKMMQKKYGAAVWTDHGDAIQMLMRSGLDDSCPEYYILPALKNAGIKYVNGLTEIIGSFSAHDTNNIHDNSAHALLYTIPDIDPCLNFFSTYQGPPSSFFKDDELDRFINNRGVVLFHCYLAHFFLDYSLDESGCRQHQLNEVFTRLPKLANRRDQGLIYLSTLSQWADYVSAVKKVKIIPMINGIITENPGKTINQMSFAQVSTFSSSKDQLFLDGILIDDFKVVNGVRYFVTDLPHGNHRITWEAPAKK